MFRHLVLIALCCATAQAADLFIDLGDFTTEDLAGRNFTLIPRSATTNGGKLIVKDARTYTADSGGAYYVSNVVDGSYYLDVAPPNVKLQPTRYLLTVPVTNAMLNAADLVTATEAPGGLQAYTQAQANGRFLQRTNGTGANLSMTGTNTFNVVEADEFRGDGSKLTGITGSGGSTSTNSGVVFLDVNGNDNSAVVGRVDKPFGTLAAAFAVMTNNMELRIGPGVFLLHPTNRTGSDMVNYRVNSPAQLNDMTNISVVGSGYGTRIVLDGLGYGLVCNNVSNALFRGFSIEGSNGVQLASGDYISSFLLRGTCGHMTVENVRFYKSVQHGFTHLYNARTSHDITLRGCEFWYTGCTNFTGYAGVDGTAVAGIGPRWRILDNDFFYNLRDIEAETYDYAPMIDDVVCSGNRHIGTYQYAYMVWPKPNAMNISKVTISDFTISNMVMLGQWMPPADGPRTAITVSSVDGLTIRNGIIDNVLCENTNGGLRSYGIRLVTSSGPLRDVLIENVKFARVDASPITTGSSSASISNIVVRGCDFSYMNPSNWLGTHAIDLAGSFCRIYDNTFGPGAAPQSACVNLGGNSRDTDVFGNFQWDESDQSRWPQYGLKVGGNPATKSIRYFDNTWKLVSVRGITNGVGPHGLPSRQTGTNAPSDTYDKDPNGSTWLTAGADGGGAYVRTNGQWRPVVLGDTNGAIVAAKFIGDGSELTGITTGAGGHTNLADSGSVLRVVNGAGDASLEVTGHQTNDGNLVLSGSLDMFDSSLSYSQGDDIAVWTNRFHATGISLGSSIALNGPVSTPEDITIGTHPTTKKIYFGGLANYFGRGTIHTTASELGLYNDYALGNIVLITAGGTGLQIASNGLVSIGGAAIAGRILTVYGSVYNSGGGYVAGSTGQGFNGSYLRNWTSADNLTVGTITNTSLIFNISGYEVGRFWTNGAFGIGTATPATTLDVRGNSLWVAGDGSGSLPASAGYGLRLYRNTIMSWDYANSRSSNLVINPAGGSVGIGTEPGAYKLNINGGLYANAASTFSLSGGAGAISTPASLYNGGTSQTNNGIGIPFFVKTSDGNYQLVGRIDSTILDTNTASFAGALIFNVAGDGIAASERMRLTRNRLGIGITNPAYALHLVSTDNTSMAIEGGASKQANLMYRQNGVSKWQSYVPADGLSYRIYDSADRMTLTSTSAVFAGKIVGDGSLLTNLPAAPSGESYWPTNLPALTLDDQRSTAPNSLRLTGGANVTMTTNGGDLVVAATAGGGHTNIADSGAVLRVVNGAGNASLEVTGNQTNAGSLTASSVIATLHGDGQGVSNVTAAPTHYELGTILPLDLPTYDDRKHVTHPNIIALATNWNGYRYWLAYTPFPFSSREFPHVACSHDGINWRVPPGATNGEAIVLPTTNGVSHGFSAGYDWPADPEILLRADGTMNLYYVWTGQRQASTTLTQAMFVVTTTNGATWTTPTLIAASGEFVTNSVMCGPQAVIQTNGLVRLYYVAETTGPTNRLRSIDSDASGIAFGGVQTNSLATVFSSYLATVTELNAPWHFDVVYAGGRYHMLCGDNTGSWMHYTTSDDGTNWSQPQFPALKPELWGWGSKGVTGNQVGYYKPALVAKPGAPIRWDIYIGTYDTSGATGNTNEWRIGLMRDVELPQQNVGIFSTNAVKQVGFYSPATDDNRYGMLQLYDPGRRGCVAIGSPVQGNYPGLWSSTGEPGIIDVTNMFLIEVGNARKVNVNYNTTGYLSVNNTAIASWSNTLFRVLANLDVTGKIYGDGSMLTNLPAATSGESYWPTNLPVLVHGSDQTATAPNSLKLAAGSGVSLATNTSSLIVSADTSVLATLSVLTNHINASRVMTIAAGAMTPSTTNGAAIGTNAPAGSGNLTEDVYLFDDTTEESVQVQFALTNYTSLKAVVYWTTAAASGSCAWKLSVLRVTHDDALGAAFPAAVSVTNTVTAAGDSIVSSEITLSPSGTGEDHLLKISRDPGIDGDLTGDVKLRRIVLKPIL